MYFDNLDSREFKKKKKMLRVSRASRWAPVAVQGEGLCLTIKSVSVCLSFLVDIDRILLYRSIDERTLVYFADNPRHILEADIERGRYRSRLVLPPSESRCKFLLPPIFSLYFSFFLNWRRDLVEFGCGR